MNMQPSPRWGTSQRRSALRWFTSCFWALQLGHLHPTIFISSVLTNSIMRTTISPRMGTLRGLTRSATDQHPSSLTCTKKVRPRSWKYSIIMFNDAIEPICYRYVMHCDACYVVQFRFLETLALRIKPPMCSPFCPDLNKLGRFLRRRISGVQHNMMWSSPRSISTWPLWRSSEQVSKRDERVQSTAWQLHEAHLKL